MKTIKTLALFLGLSLGIASCSKEGQDSPVVERQVEGASKHVGSKDSVLVSFTIGADTEELRLAQSLNADGVPVSPFMEEKDVVIRFAVRKSGRVTYTDAVCKKVAGENRVTYKGIIRLPDLGYGNTPPTNLTGHEIAGILLGEANNGTQFVEQVDANTVKSIEQTELLTAEDNVVRSKVPYLLDWQSFPLTAQGVQQSKLQLTFKPIGNLLRIQFNNQLDEAKTLQSIKVSSNAFTTQAKIDFAKSGNLRQNPTEYNQSIPSTSSGLPIESMNTGYQMEKTYQLTTPIRVEAKAKSKWYYLWVMPLVYNQVDIDNASVFLNTQAIGKTTDNEEFNMFTLCNSLLEGSNRLSMSLEIKVSTLATAFKDGKLPLWYIAEYNVAPGGKSLTNTHTMPFTEALQSSAFGYYMPSNLDRINVPGYYVPDMYDFGAVIGTSRIVTTGARVRNTIFRNGDYSHSDYNNGLTEEQALKLEENSFHKEGYEWVRMPGESNAKLYHSTYQSIDPYNTYALRFVECGNRERLTAYRYQFVNLPVTSEWGLQWYDFQYKTIDEVKTQTNAALVVSSVFLGSGFTGDINTISTPEFWNNSKNTPGYVERRFPILEFEDPNNEDWTLQRIGRVGITQMTYLLADRIMFRAEIYRPDHSYSPNLTHGVVLGFANFQENKFPWDLNPGYAYSYSDEGHFHFPVRLFKNEYKTAR